MILYFIKSLASEPSSHVSSLLYIFCPDFRSTPYPGPNSQSTNFYLNQTRTPNSIQTLIRLQNTNTNSLANKFSKILPSKYFGYVTKGYEVFFDADSESTHRT